MRPHHLYGIVTDKNRLAVDNGETIFVSEAVPALLVFGVYTRQFCLGTLFPAFASVADTPLPRNACLNASIYLMSIVGDPLLLVVQKVGNYSLLFRISHRPDYVK